MVASMWKKIGARFVFFSIYREILGQGGVQPVFPWCFGVVCCPPGGSGRGVAAWGQALPHRRRPPDRVFPRFCVVCFGVLVWYVLGFWCGMFWDFGVVCFGIFDRMVWPPSPVSAGLLKCVPPCLEEFGALRGRSVEAQKS